MENTKIAYCKVIKDYEDEAENTRIRILELDDGKLYWHKMQNGKVTECEQIGKAGA